MDAFGIEEGFCGGGAARYTAGLITLPDGSTRGIETVRRIAVRDPTDGAARAGDVAGSFRDVLDKATPVFLPLRLALSTMRAGLGVIEEGLRPPEGLRVELEFDDGASIVALMSRGVATLLQRDGLIARGAIKRAGRVLGAKPSRPAQAASAPPTPDTAPDEALTSIFRYEKRNGRLRRVAAPGTPES